MTTNSEREKMLAYLALHCDNESKRVVNELETSTDADFDFNCFENVKDGLKKKFGGDMIPEVSEETKRECAEKELPINTVRYDQSQQKLFFSGTKPSPMEVPWRW